MMTAHHASLLAEAGRGIMLVFNVFAWPLRWQGDPRGLACAENGQDELNRSSTPMNSLALSFVATSSSKSSKSRATPLENTGNPPPP
jgi:hypothetical protein